MVVFKVDCITLGNTAYFTHKAYFKEKKYSGIPIFQTMQWKWAQKIGGQVHKIEGNFLLFLLREVKIALNNREVQIIKGSKNRDCTEKNV